MEIPEMLTITPAPTTRPLVILESPFGGNPETFVPYARRCIKDCLERGEAPIASHLLYTQPGILRDNVADERALGIESGLAWYRVAERCVVYMDHGISRGMLQGISRARFYGVEVVQRILGT